MENPIISTKGTNQITKNISIFAAAFSLILFVAVLTIVYGKINSHPSIYRPFVKRSYIPIITLATFIGIFGSLVGTYGYTSCRSYVDVYKDRVEGKVIQGAFQIVDIYLPYDKITSVTFVRNQLFLNTVGRKYRVITNPSTAKAIFDFYNRVDI